LQSLPLSGLRSNGGHRRIPDRFRRGIPREWRICWERHQEFDFQGFGIHGGLAMAREPKKLDDLFHDTLKDIYFAEKKILTALPKMAKAAHSEDLRAAFEKHYSETEGQVERLERVFDLIGKKAQGKTCDAIIGIVEEGQEVMKEYKGSPALDAGLLAGAQAVEHYEISRYGTLKTWANELGLGDAVGLLDATLQEEKKTDATLTKIAESIVNQEAE
jgi:ferritin-like metal-binding protein YciE